MVAIWSHKQYHDIMELVLEKKKEFGNGKNFKLLNMWNEYHVVLTNHHKHEDQPNKPNDSDGSGKQ